MSLRNQLVKLIDEALLTNQEAEAVFRAEESFVPKHETLEAQLDIYDNLLDILGNASATAHEIREKVLYLYKHTPKVAEANESLLNTSDEETNEPRRLHLGSVVVGRRKLRPEEKRKT